jgi:hypothetical protein
MSFLFGPSNEYKIVEPATSELLVTPDVGKGMEISDAINSSKDQSALCLLSSFVSPPSSFLFFLSPHSGKAYLKAIKKRLAETNSKIVFNTLAVRALSLLLFLSVCFGFFFRSFSFSLLSSCF